MPRAGVSAGVPQTRVDPADLAFEIQRTLAALADMETRYEVERERVNQWTGPISWKDRVRAGVEARRARERQPLALRMADLQQEMSSSLTFRSIPQH